tara:strand:- start:1057 stop:1767 length:711 start_codon:yes stop_codon:yes gene_type:complete
MPLPNPVGRVLLVLTTSGSNGHLRALQCLGDLGRPQAALLRHAEVRLHTTVPLDAKFAGRFARAFPTHARTVVVTPPQRRGQNEQVIDTFLHALRPAALARYDWVLVSNVDVVIANATRLTAMLANPETWAVLANCNPDRRCTTGCIQGLVHSDFFAFRPREVRFHNETVLKQHAETYVTQIFYPAIALARDAWIQARGFRDRSCRIRAGVRAGSPEVVHYHRGGSCAAPERKGLL